MEVEPRREHWWLHGLLFALTFVTTTYVGANFAVNFRPSLLTPGAETAATVAALFRGAITFSVPLLLILLAHEMGHYLMCRRYGIDASPPYFIPFPSLVGTMGAFIRIRQQIPDKKKLFDIGVAGPIAGFVVTLPLLAWGIAHTRPNPASVLSEGTILFRYPLLVTLFQKLVLGTTFTSVDAVEHPVFIAAWFGLFVTALNLLPLGQLDGGHALYAVSPRLHRKLSIPFASGLVILGAWNVQPIWILWGGLGLTPLRRHPPLPNEAESLGRARQIVAIAVLAILILSFTPDPLLEIAGS